MSIRYYGPLLLVALGVAGTSGIRRSSSSVEIHPIAISADVTPYSTNTQRFWIVNTAAQNDQYSIFANVCTSKKSPARSGASRFSSFVVRLAGSISAVASASFAFAGSISIVPENFVNRPRTFAKTMCLTVNPISV